MNLESLALRVKIAKRAADANFANVIRLNEILHERREDHCVGTVGQYLCFFATQLGESYALAVHTEPTEHCGTEFAWELLVGWVRWRELAWELRAAEADFDTAMAKYREELLA